MKILQINTFYKRGSTGNIVANLHKLILDKGYESFVGYGRGNFNEDRIFKIGTPLDMYVHGAGTRILDRHGLFSRRATMKFLQQIDALDPNIFHLHNIHGYYLHYPSLFEYLKQKNKPVVWTLHDCWAYTGHCAHYDFAGCSKWQTQCFSCPQKNKYPASYVLDNSENNFRLKKKFFTSPGNMVIVTPSRWLKQEVGKSFLNKYKTQVINNGIDLHVFSPKESDFRKRYSLTNTFLILGVANDWSEYKGLDYFIRLSRLIKQDEKIVLVGLNAQQIKALPQNIFGFKRTGSLDELAEIYSACDVFVNPTLEENFPTTNLESQACGTPVVTFNSGGSGETIDENCGFIVDKGDLNGLYQKIQMIKKKGKETFSEKCRERAVKFFDKNQRFEEYITLYEELYNSESS